MGLTNNAKCLDCGHKYERNIQVIYSLHCAHHVVASKIKSGTFVTLLIALLATVATSCSRSGRDSGSAGSRGGEVMVPTVKITRVGDIPISPYAFGNNYFNWVDWNNDGMIALLGTEEPVRALRLNVVVGDNNQNDANTPQLFDQIINACRFSSDNPVRFFIDDFYLCY
jgi:hypothetical protein